MKSCSWTGCCFSESPYQLLDQLGLGCARRQEGWGGSGSYKWSLFLSPGNLGHSGLVWWPHDRQGPRPLTSCLS